MPSPLPDLRDEAYLRINLKKLAAGFSINTFTLIRTWRPRKEYSELAAATSGIVYVISGEVGDKVSLSRKNAIKGEYSVQIGYQRILTDLEDMAGIDALVDFVHDLESCVRHDISTGLYGYSRTEFEKDESGMPFNFLNFDQISTFEAYFRLFFNTAET